MDILYPKICFAIFYHQICGLDLNLTVILKKEILIFDEKELEYGLECMEVEQSKEIFFHFVVKIEGDEEKVVNVLETFDELIKNINVKCGEQFSISTLWNDVSM